MSTFNLIMWIIFIPWATWQGMDYLAECGEELDRMVDGKLGVSCERIANWFWIGTAKTANAQGEASARTKDDEAFQRWLDRAVLLAERPGPSVIQYSGDRQYRALVELQKRKVEKGSLIIGMRYE